MFWVFGKSKKTRVLGDCIDFHFLSSTRDFPSSFSLLLVSKNTLIPHLSYHLSYSIRIICFVKKEKRKRDCLWSLEPLVVNPPLFVVSLFGRGDRSGIGLLPLR